MNGIDQGGKIDVNFKTTNNSLVADIIDNGAGEKRQIKKHRSLGMSITAKRLAHINESVTNSYSIEQLPCENGTHVRVRIQL